MKTGLIYLQFILLLLLMQNARAATVQPLSLAKIIESAELIAVGECIAQVGHWQGKRIVTDNTIRLMQVIKGSSGEVVVTTLGGEAMHPGLKTKIRMSAPGATRFKIGEQVLIFTVGNSKGQQQVVGLSQGKFDVTVDPESGEAVIAVGQKTLVEENAPFNFDEFYSLSASFDSERIVLKPKQMALTTFIQKLNEEIALQTQGTEK